MGVIKNLSVTVPVLRVSEESLNSIGFSEPPTPPSEPEDLEIRNYSFTPQRRNPALLIQRLEQSTRKRAGARKARRDDNARILQSLAEEEGETGYSDPTIKDFRPNSQTPLTNLMTDFSSMRIWQYFLSQSEEEQRKYLEKIDEERQLKSNFSNLGISFTQFPHTNSKTVEDKRIVHPSFSAEQRFGLVPSSLRNILKRKHIPLAMLTHLEADITEVFCKDDDAVYVSPDLSSYERLLLHGICQYNLLKSWSMTVSGSRRTKVKNVYNCFACPETSFSQYVEKRNGSKFFNKTSTEL